MTRSIDVIELLPTAFAVTSSAFAGTAGAGLNVPIVSARAGVGSVEASGFATPVLLLQEPTEVGRDGLSFRFAWAGATGSERLELDPVVLEVSTSSDADFPGFPLGLVSVDQRDGGLRISAPGAPPLRALTFDLLRETIPDAPRLVPGDFTRDSKRHLIVRRRDPASGGWGAPVVAVPPLPAGGAVPARLVGATMSSTTLRLPDLAGQLLVQLATGDSPESFQLTPLALTDVRAWAAPIAKDLRVIGPDGAVLWSFPGEFTSATSMRSELTVGVQAALEKLRAAGQPIAGELRVISDRAARIQLRLGDVAGAQVRTLPGTTSVRLDGEPAFIALPPPSFDDAGPTSAVGDLRIAYLGARLADISDRLPEGDAVAGVAVHADRAVRDLPPESLTGATVTRIGIVGFAPVPATLLVGFAARADPSRVVGASAVVRCVPSAAWDVLWVDLPEPVVVTEPVVIAVSASEGRFNWVGAPHPLVRIVVEDPDPAGRVIVIGPEDAEPMILAAVTGAAVDVPRASLPPAVFRGERLVVASALVCTVDLTDVVLSYRRGGG